MKSITSLLAVLAIGTTLAVAADENPATPAKPEAAAGAAKPEGEKHATPEERFKKLDTNADGKISADEWNASPKAKRDAAKATELFGRKDKDGDKSLSLEEFAANGGKKKNK